MIRFLIVLVPLLILMVGALIAGARQEWWVIPSFAFEIVGIMAVFTFIVYRYLFQLRQRQPDTFGPFYLLSIALKLIAGLALLGTVIWLDKSSSLGNAVVFLISYGLFTSAEVVLLLGKN